MAGQAVPPPPRCKVLCSAPLCFRTGTRAKWRCQTVLCRQRPLSPHIRVAVETRVFFFGNIPARDLGNPSVLKDVYRLLKK